MGVDAAVDYPLKPANTLNETLAMIAEGERAIFESMMFPKPTLKKDMPIERLPIVKRCVKSGKPLAVRDEYGRWTKPVEEMDAKNEGPFAWRNDPKFW
jgi:hypothetical protein